MLTPAYKLTLGPKPSKKKKDLLETAVSAAESALGLSGGSGIKIIDTTDEPKTSTIVDLTVTLDMDTPADAFTLVLGQIGGLQPAWDDQAKIELGYADNGGLTEIMTGTVDIAEPNLTTTRIVGYSAAATLLRTFVDQTYESKTAGQIVRDLADKATVEVATAEDGINFPAYVIDGRRSVYDHMQDLAELCGFDLYINSEDKLIFEKFIGGKIVHVFEYAKHIVSLNVLQTPLRAESIEAFGESPGANRGKESWAWLTKDFDKFKGSAGSGDPKFLFEKPVLRTAVAARTAATSVFTTIQRRAIRGKLLSVGRPEVKLGDAIHLRDVPDEAMNGVFQVRGVTHRITKLGGFTTLIDFRSINP